MNEYVVTTRVSDTRSIYLYQSIIQCGDGFSIKNQLLLSKKRSGLFCVTNHMNALYTVTNKGFSHIPNPECDDPVVR